MTLKVAHAQDQTDQNAPVTNLQVMQSLVGEITGEILERSGIGGRDTIGLSMYLSADSWITEHAIESRLRAAGNSVVVQPASRPQAPYQLTVDAAELHVRYDDAFRRGIFGTRMVRRTVSVGLSARCVRASTGEVMFGGPVDRMRADTVSIDDISTLELAGAAATHGEVPEGGLLDRFIEPFVIIGTTGVAVYLFFHLRS